MMKARTTDDATRLNPWELKALIDTILNYIRGRHGNLASQLLKNIHDYTPFELLVGIVLSQNTSDINAHRAFMNLRSALGGRITPEKMLQMPLEVLENSIRIAGLYRRRALMLKEIARNIIEFGGLERILEMEPERARAELLKIPGIGFKTADLLLLITKGYPYFPVDTHIMRIVGRLRATRSRSYEEISNLIKSLYRPSEYLEVHLALIRFGREICKSRNPLCDRCPIARNCPSSRCAILK